MCRASVIMCGKFWLDIIMLLVYNNHGNKETKKIGNKIIWIKRVCLHIMIRRSNYVRYNCNER